MLFGNFSGSIRFYFISYIHIDIDFIKGFFFILHLVGIVIDVGYKNKCKSERNFRNKENHKFLILTAITASLFSGCGTGKNNTEVMKCGKMTPSLDFLFDREKAINHID